jgi:hypothetical protein
MARAESTQPSPQVCDLFPGQGRQPVEAVGSETFGQAGGLSPHQISTPIPSVAAAYFFPAAAHLAAATLCPQQDIAQ